MRRRPLPNLVAVRCLLVALLLVVCSPGYSLPARSSMEVAWLPSPEALGQRQHSAHYWFDKGLQAFAAEEYVLAERLWLNQAWHAPSQYHLGVLYDRLEPGSARAFAWYLKAARQGHVDAQHNVALALARGEGTRQDIRQALWWWRQAARQGSRDSSYNLGVIYALGADGVHRNLHKAEQWWLQAARLGDAMAQYNLGALYVSGVDAGNTCKALHWFRMSSANGFSRAGRALSELEARLPAQACP